MYASWSATLKSRGARVRNTHPGAAEFASVRSASRRRSLPANHADFFAALGCNSGSLHQLHDDYVTYTLTTDLT